MGKTNSKTETGEVTVESEVDTFLIQADPFNQGPSDRMICMRGYIRVGYRYLLRGASTVDGRTGIRSDRQQSEDSGHDSTKREERGSWASFSPF